MFLDSDAWFNTNSSLNESPVDFIERTLKKEGGDGTAVGMVAKSHNVMKNETGTYTRGWDATDPWAKATIMTAKEASAHKDGRNFRQVNTGVFAFDGQSLEADRILQLWWDGPTNDPIMKNT